MAPAVTAYNSALINSLPDQGSAIKTYEKGNATELLYGAIKDAFVKHSATGKFGIQLIHKPSFGIPPPPSEDKDAPQVDNTLKDSDRVIRAGNVAFVADITTIPQEVRETVVPIVWGFKSDGSIFPLEFALSADPTKDQLTASDLALVADIGAILAGKSFGSILGLSLRAYQAAGVKTRFGAAGVTLPFQFVDLFPGDARYETAWAFGIGEGEVEVQGLVCASSGAQSFGKIIDAEGGDVVVTDYVYPWPGHGKPGQQGYPYPGYPNYPGYPYYPGYPWPVVPQEDAGKSTTRDKVKAATSKDDKDAGYYKRR